MNQNKKNPLEIHPGGDFKINMSWIYSPAKGPNPVAVNKIFLISK